MLTEATFNEMVGLLSSLRDKEGQLLKMKSVIASKGNDRFEHYFDDDKGPVDLRSVSKPILCLGIGAAMADGFKVGGRRLSLDMKIWPFFEKQYKAVAGSNERFLSEVEFRHLLNHTIGHDEGLLFSADIKDLDKSKLLELVFSHPIKYRPGEYFVYSNAAPYIISALVQDNSYTTIDSLCDKYIFNPLGVADWSWRKIGPYCAGNSGLSLNAGDLHKIGALFVSNGRFNGASVVPEEWVEFMRQATVETPSMYDPDRVFPKYGYGCYLWKTERGDYYCDGTNGQYLIVLNDNKTLITTLAVQPDMKPITQAMRPLVAV